MQILKLIDFDIDNLAKFGLATSERTNSWLSVPASWLTWRQAVGSNPGAVKAIKLVSNTDIINLPTAIICNGQGQIWPYNGDRA